MAVALQNTGPAERARHLRRLVDDIGLTPQFGQMTDRLEGMLSREDDPRVAEMIITAIALAGLKGDGNGLQSLLRVQQGVLEIEKRFRENQGWSDSVDGSRDKFTALFESQLTKLVAIHQAILDLPGEIALWGEVRNHLGSDLLGSLEARFNKIR